MKQERRVIEAANMLAFQRARREAEAKEGRRRDMHRKQRPHQDDQERTRRGFRTSLRLRFRRVPS